jgi:hypothetical protein
VGTEWSVGGTSDYNGNATSDILWHSDSGASAIWDMAGGALVASHPLGVVGTEWHIFG